MVAFPSMLPDSKRDTKHCKGPATTALTGMLPTPAAGIASSLRASVMQYASTGIIPTAFGWIYAEVTQNWVAVVASNGDRKRSCRERVEIAVVGGVGEIREKEHGRLSQ